MDHLLVPKHPAHRPPRVRYFCRQYYDRGNFLTYPERMGWIDDGDTWLDLSVSHDAEEASAFLQQWLFFGLLHEFFGDLADFSAFVDTDSSTGIRYIHTRELLPLARTFMGRERSEKRLLLKDFSIKQCLEKTYSIYHAVTDEQDEFLDPYFQLSLVATARFLTHVASLLYPDEFEQRPWTLPCVKLEESRLANAKDEINADMDILGVQMIDSGWCPRQVGIAERCSFETYYFCSRLQLGRPEKNLSHHTCTQMQCLALQVEAGTYRTKHVRPDCDCARLSPDTAAVGTILRAGDIPIAAFDDANDTLSLSSASVDSPTTTTTTTTTPYIAISHTWSDGLGNPHANALPLCQLRRIAALVRTLSHPQPNPSTPDRPRPPSFFWMDTLCCPVPDPAARKLAIQRMRHTYQRSARVLVLAADLQAVRAADLPVLDRVYLAALSSWTSRLWTLQEGALGSHLDMLFADTVFRLDSARGADLAAEDARGLARASPVDFDYMLGLVRGDGPSSSSSSSSSAPGGGGEPPVAATRFSLGFASVALSRRATSVREDEALCLGSLLEADVRAITAAPREERMKALWATLPSVPREVLFLRQETMGEAGWRWAPRTFLGVPGAGSGVVLGREGTACVTGEGLRTAAWGVELDGFVCPLERPIFGVLRIRDGKSGEVYSLIRQAPLLGAPEQASHVFTVPDAQFTRVALLLEDRRIGRGGIYCAMVFVYKEDGGVIYARRGDPAFITTRDIGVDWEGDGSSSEPKETDNFFEDEWGGEMYFEATGTLQEEPQAWCID